MKKQLVSLICTVMLLVPCLASAQNTVEVTTSPVVVTATRIEVPLAGVGKTVTVVTAEQLERQKVTTLAQALQNIPGLLVRQQRGLGGMVYLKIRGLDSEYTQVLIDGLPVRDPSETQGTAVEFMDDILIENIERIEIVRGSSSTLYGSDSVGGTINIITKKGTEDPEFFASFEGGSMSTFQEAAGLRGLVGSVNYALTGKRADSEGIDDHDDFSENAFSGRVGVDFSENTSLSAQVKYSDSESDLNNSPGILEGVVITDEDDSDDTKEKTLVSTGIVFEQQLSESFDYTVKFGYVDVDREYTFGGDGDEYGYGSTSTYKGNTMNAEVQGNYSLTDTNILTFGYEYEAEEFEQELGDRKDTPDATSNAVYLQNSLSFMDEQFNLVPGVRYMDHDQAGDRVDWEVSASYLLGETGQRLHGHIGTGFRAPSLYELYGAAVFSGTLYEYGNEDLDPEESLGWDLGIEFKAFDEKARLDITYFSNEFDEIIAFGTTGYENIDGGESKGVEVEASYALTDSLNVTGSYTYTDTEDDNGDKFYNAPEHEIGMNVNYRFLEKFNANLGLTIRGDEDIALYDSTTYASERYENDGFTKVDLALDYAATEKIKVWTRVENLFDEDYTIGGYEAAGLSVYGGIKVTM